MQVAFPIVASLESIIPYAIPVVAILGGFSVAIVAMYLDSKKEERRQKERMFLAEKGLEIPKELFDAQEKKTSDLRGTRTWLIALGIMSLFVGIGVMILLGVQGGIQESISGVVLVAIGVGFLVTERLITHFVIKPGQERK